MHGGSDVGRALVAAVNHVVFVGSVGVGRAVAAAAAARGVGCTLELGGKDPAIVLGGASMDKAVRGVARGAFYNGGQLCVGIERCYVLAPVFDAFVEALVAHVGAHVRAGYAAPPAAGTPPGGSDSAAPTYTYGPVIAAGHLDSVHAAVTEAVAAGATVRTGGAPSACGRFYPPTVVTFPSLEAAAGTRLLTEETFGPVLPVIPVPDVDTAVRAANGTRFGLGAYVWCPDQRAGEAIARRLVAGGVSVNEVLLHPALPGVPFGGVRASGVGRVGGKEGFVSLTVTQTVIVGGGGTAAQEALADSIAAKRALLRVAYGPRWEGVRVLWEALRAALGRLWGGGKVEGKRD